MTLVNSTSSYADGWQELIPTNPEIRQVHLVFFTLGGFIAVFGLVSLIVKDKLFMSEAFVACVFGIIVGPVALGLFDPVSKFGGDLNLITLELSRIVLVVQCVAAGISCPGNYVYKQWRSLFTLLGPVMLYSWLMSAFGIWLIFGMNFLDALLIAACVTPTDPVLANSIVKGRFADAHVPYWIRLLLSAESAANDGLGLPYLLLPIYLSRYSNAGIAFGEWIARVILYQVGVSLVLGLIIGVVCRKALKQSQRNGWVDKESLLSFSVAIALLIAGALSALGVDDVFASFIAGNVLTWDNWFNKQVADSKIQEVVDALINLTYFIFIGTRIPWASFGTPGLEVWKLVLISIWLLILRRLPVVMLMSRFIPAIQSPREAFFTGWFGPVGAGAIFYCMLAIVYFDIPAQPLFPIVIFIVMSSILLHGGSVGLFHFGIKKHDTWMEWRQSVANTNRACASLASAESITSEAFQIHSSNAPAPQSRNNPKLSFSDDGECNPDHGAAVEGGESASIASHSHHACAHRPFYAAVSASSASELIGDAEGVELATLPRSATK